MKKYVPFGLTLFAFAVWSGSCLYVVVILIKESYS